jgi:hypothetical protein
VVSFLADFSLSEIDTLSINYSPFVMKRFNGINPTDAQVKLRGARLPRGKKSTAGA